MRRNLLILAGAISVLLLFPVQSWAACPEDTVDRGECDTLYVEVYPADEHPLPPGPALVRFSIYVTNDIPDPSLDSITGFVVPLCYTCTDPTYCTLTTEWNNTNLYPFPDLDRSIFRHYIEYGDTVVHNWMMTLSQRLDGSEWDTRILELDGTSHFWLALFPTGSEDQRFSGGSRVLLATMTFKLEIPLDCYELTIDTCFWPPNSRLSFTRGDGPSYIPRHFLPKSWWFGIPWGWVDCPHPESRNTNGTFQSDGKFMAGCEPCGFIHVSLDYHPLPPGIAEAHVVYTTPPGGHYVDGHISYTVSDHCQSGGWIVLEAFNNVVNGPVDWCGFEVLLSNTPPGVDLPETVFAIAGHSLTLNVYGEDPDGDSVETVDFDTLWFQADPSQSPVNPPSCQPGYPAAFSWTPTESDTGSWICSFLATDACGDVGAGQTVIRVGMPFCGDCTGEGRVDVSDVVYLIGYLFKAGPAPDPPCKGDVTCDGSVEAGDLVYLINYFFRFGPAPCFDCCP